MWPFKKNKDNIERVFLETEKSFVVEEDGRHKARMKELDASTKKTEEKIKECRAEAKRQIEELTEFRAVGDKFNYLGIELTVCTHAYYDPGTSCFYLRFKAAYVNNHGELKGITFNYEELPALRKENP